jgi:hypothetical protein
MTGLTKKQLQHLFIEEFCRRLRAAPPGQKVFMQVGDLFQPAEVHDLDEWRRALAGDSDIDGESGTR